MKILTVEPAGNLWGSERALLDLIAAAPGADFAVCCPPGTSIIPLLEAREIPCLPFYVSGLQQKSRINWLRASMGVLKACLAFKPDVLHVNQAGAYRTCLPAIRLLGLPMVCHVRIYEDVPHLARRIAGHRKGLALVAVSASVGQALQARSELADFPVRNLYDPFSMPSQPSHCQGKDSRIICLGRIAPSKGQHLLIEAVLDHHLDQLAEVVLVGTGEPSYLRDLMDRAGGRVKFHGFDPDAAKRLRPGDILVVPSEREPLGRVILEAWAAGALPVAGRSSGGAAEIIEKSEGGLFYDAPSADALASALRRAWELGGELRIERSARGRRWAMQHCDPHDRAADFLAVVSEILAPQ